MDTDGLCLYVKEELRDVFGRHGVDSDGEACVKPPPEPMQEDSFIQTVTNCLIKYINASRPPPLDFDMGEATFRRRHAL